MRRNTFFWGSVFILAGFLFLLDNLGIIRIDVWSLIWPLVLIALGVWTLSGVLFRRPASSEHINIPLEGASKANLQFQHGAGRLRIFSQSMLGDLIEGDFEGGAEVHSSHAGDQLDVKLNPPVPGFSFPWSGRGFSWSVGINSDVSLSIDLETGANEAQVDLDGLKVSDLHLKSGASSTELTLPSNAGFTQVKVEAGAASVNIHIPSGVAARIKTSGGLSSFNVDTSRFPRSGDGYQSPDYESAVNKADIEVEMGVGSVTVR